MEIYKFNLSRQEIDHRLKLLDYKYNKIRNLHKIINDCQISNGNTSFFETSVKLPKKIINDNKNSQLISKVNLNLNENSHNNTKSNDKSKFSLFSLSKKIHKRKMQINNFPLKNKINISFNHMNNKNEKTLYVPSEIDEKIIQTNIQYAKDLGIYDHILDKIIKPDKEMKIKEKKLDFLKDYIFNKQSNCNNSLSINKVNSYFLNPFENDPSETYIKKYLAETKNGRVIIRPKIKFFIRKNEIKEEVKNNDNERNKIKNKTNSYVNNNIFLQTDLTKGKERKISFIENFKINTKNNKESSLFLTQPNSFKGNSKKNILNTNDSLETLNTINTLVTNTKDSIDNISKSNFSKQKNNMNKSALTTNTRLINIEKKSKIYNTCNRIINNTDLIYNTLELQELVDNDIFKYKKYQRSKKNDPGISMFFKIRNKNIDNNTYNSSYNSNNIFYNSNIYNRNGNINHSNSSYYMNNKLNIINNENSDYKNLINISKKAIKLNVNSALNLYPFFKNEYRIFSEREMKDKYFVGYLKNKLQTIDKIMMANEKIKVLSKNISTVSLNN